ncbi:MAG TPA: hypothetical protein VFO36_06145, partial [Nitrospiraceae bacterium]|nr:hypothetical protein [Nitrospiraceae bacterium]
GRLLAHLDERMRGFIAARAPHAAKAFFVTCEQNDPSRMSADQLEDDLKAAGIAPATRLAWWRKRGYRRLDFRYEQPPLHPDADPCTYLDYYARLSDGEPSANDSIGSAVLIEHLRRFFFVSVGKFAFDMNKNPQWLRQKRELEHREEIRLTA